MPEAKQDNQLITEVRRSFSRILPNGINTVLANLANVNSLNVLHNSISYKLYRANLTGSVVILEIPEPSLLLIQVLVQVQFGCSSLFPRQLSRGLVLLI